MKLLLVPVLLALASCATYTPQQSIAATCQAIASTEDALALVKLNDAQKAVVRKAIAIKAPVCNVAPYPSSVSDATFATLNGALQNLVQVKQEAKP